MTSYTIHIPGPPYAKKRPRFSRASGRAYDPKENTSFERTVGTLAREQIAEPLVGPVRVAVAAIFVPPPSWSKTRRADAMTRPHCQKPDSDNVLKAVLDGLNRIAFADDAQVAEIYVEKRWGHEARTTVQVVAL